MAATGMPMWFTLVLLATGSGSNELLDLVPTGLYWQMQEVEVSTAAMLGHLKVAEAGDVGSLLKELGSDQYKVRAGAHEKLLAMGPGIIDRIRPALKSPDAEVAVRVKQIIAALSARRGHGSVRRLMAIRTLGEMKIKEALGALRKLAGSKELFVADYAMRAIAAIEGRAPAAIALSAKRSMEDVWLLPAGCGLVAQATLGGGEKLDLATAMRSMLPVMGRSDPNQMIRKMVGGLLGVADKIGNVRVDSLTLGLADNVGGSTGFVVVVARGLYDAEKAKVALVEAFGRPLSVRKIGGVEMYLPDTHFALIFPSNQRVVLVGGPDRQQLPLEAVAKAIVSGKGALAGDKQMAALIAKVDKSGALWAAARISKHYRKELPFVAPFKTATFSAKRAEGRTLLALHAEGDDPNAIRACLARFEEGLTKVRQQVADLSERMPAVKGLADLLAGVKISQRGTRASIIAAAEGDALSALMMAPMLLVSGHATTGVAANEPRRVRPQAVRTRPARPRTRPAKVNP